MFYQAGIWSNLTISFVPCCNRHSPFFWQVLLREKQALWQFSFSAGNVQALYEKGQEKRSSSSVVQWSKGVMFPTDFCVGNKTFLFSVVNKPSPFVQLVILQHRQALWYSRCSSGRRQCLRPSVEGNIYIGKSILVVLRGIKYKYFRIGGSDPLLFIILSSSPLHEPKLEKQDLQLKLGSSFQRNSVSVLKKWNLIANLYFLYIFN